MNGTILPFTVVLDNGPLSAPAWTLDVAIEAAREAEGAGRTAKRITQGAHVVLEGGELRQAMDG